MDRPMGRRRTVEPGSAEDAKFPFEPKSYIRGREAFDIERKRGDPIRSIFGSEEFDSRNVSQSIPQVFEEPQFVPSNRFKSSLFDKLQTGEKSGNSDAVRCPALEAIRQEIRLLFKFGPASCPSLDSSLNERPLNKKGKLFAALFVLETAK